MVILEIMLSVLAVFGGYTLVSMLKAALLYPKKIRKKVRCALIADGTDATAAAAYCRYLRLSGKISSERLIILVKDDIIECNENLSDLGEVWHII